MCRQTFSLYVQDHVILTNVLLENTPTGTESFCQWETAPAILFRHMYYLISSHAGFIIYMTDAAQNHEEVNNIREAMKSAKGPSNLSSWFMFSPNGKKNGIQIISQSEVAAKDEFLDIRRVIRDDMMAAQRMPPKMMGIIPNSTC